MYVLFKMQIYVAPAACVSSPRLIIRKHCKSRGKCHAPIHFGGRSCLAHQVVATTKDMCACHLPSRGFRLHPHNHPRYRPSHRRNRQLLYHHCKPRRSRGMLSRLRDSYYRLLLELSVAMTTTCSFVGHCYNETSRWRSLDKRPPPPVGCLL